MKNNRLTDIEKLCLIAKTFSYIKGEFTSEMIYDFLLNHDYTFKKEMDTGRIGVNIGRSKDFITKGKKCGVNYFEAL